MMNIGMNSMQCDDNEEVDEVVQNQFIQDIMTATALQITLDTIITVQQTLQRL